MGIWGFCQCIDRALQKDPVGFGSCICTPKPTSHVKSSLGSRVLYFEHRSRRHLHSDGVPVPLSSTTAIMFLGLIVLYPPSPIGLSITLLRMGFPDIGYRLGGRCAMMSGMVEMRRIVIGLH